MKLKEERGSMAVYTLVVLLGMLVILVATLLISNSIRKSQIDTVIKIKQTYEADNSRAAEIYENLTGTGGSSEPDSDYVQEGLILHYDAINNTGNGHSNSTTTWKDLSGNGNDGTLSTSPSNSTFYWENNSLTISGHSGNLQYYVDTPLRLTGQERTYIYTIDANNLQGSIWGETNSANTNGLFNYYNFVANRGGSTSSQSRFSYTFAKSGIYSYAVTVSNSQIKFYVNGELTRTIDNTIGLACSNNLRLMAARYNDQNATNLKMYQFLAYNRVLSDSEILENYNISKEEYNIGSGENPGEEPEDTYVDSVLPTAPKVSSGMIPVKWDSNNNVWVRTDVTDSEWYDYANKKWANVVLEDASWNGNNLNESANYTMLVWIPRFAYQIETQYHTTTSSAGNINIVFIDQENKNKNGSETYTSDYPTATAGANTGMNGYVVHPAFDYGNNKLSGFWVGKYETSNTEETTGYSDSKVVQIKPGVTSWRNLNVSNMYTVCTNMNASENPYGLNTDDSVVDPHLMKNSEWGAVAYLSKSIYGKNDEVWINPNNGYLTGQAGSSASSSSAGTTQTYYTANGQQASTTGNTTGIYDMSGGAYEYVAGYINNSYASRNAANLVNADDRYKDVYTTTSDSSSTNYNNMKPSAGHYGDAVWETSGTTSMNGSWYSDYAFITYSSTPFFERGGYYSDNNEAGMFSFSNYSGAASSSRGFRVVIPVIKEETP